MRVTTQMLNESARKTGLPFSYGNSLLDYVNNSNTSGGNPLLDALNKNSSSSAISSGNGNINALLNSLNKTGGEKLRQQADHLAQAAGVFTVEGEESVFEKAKESGDRTDIYRSAEKLVESYNAAMKELQNTSDSLNQYYGQMLGEAVVENAAALNDVGITMEKDGTLSLDKNKMKSASDESLEKALGVSGTFTKKAAFIASRISENAQAEIQSISSQYNMAGNTYAAVSGRYDFRG